MGVLFAAMLTDGLIGYYGYLGSAIRSGNWSYSKFIQIFVGRSFFMMETLHTIGWCMIINGIIHYLLIRKNGFKKIKRNVLVYAILVLTVIVASPFVGNWVDNMNWGDFIILISSLKYLLIRDILVALGGQMGLIRQKLEHSRLVFSHYLQVI